MTEQSSKFKELKPLENAQAPEEESVTKKLSFWLNSSVVVAIISGILGTTLGAFITGYYTLLLEEKKYEYSLGNLEKKILLRKSWSRQIT